ncbi:unnamed protein product, partial [Musa hybrid cultivar]
GVCLPSLSRTLPFDHAARRDLLRPRPDTRTGETPEPGADEFPHRRTCLPPRRPRRPRYLSGPSHWLPSPRPRPPPPPLPHRRRPRRPHPRSARPLQRPPPHLRLLETAPPSWPSAGSSWPAPRSLLSPFRPG